IVNGEDIRMRERGHREGLALEAAQRLGVLRERRRQDLDRDVPLELRVASPVDLAHPAGADRREDLVGSELRRGGQGHPSWAELYTAARARIRESRSSQPVRATSAEPRRTAPCEEPCRSNRSFPCRRRWE